MKFDIVRLNNNIVSSIPIDITYSFNPNELEGTDLIKLDIKVEGELFKNSLGNIEIDSTVSGVMVIHCAISLKPVNYPFSLNISGDVTTLFEINETNFQNTIDIFPIIWENILMEIPTRVVSDDAKDLTLKGDGWSFTTKEEVNSPLSELMDMIDDSEVK